MELNFLGIGSCFAKDHNCAFFTTSENNFVLIDCPELAFETLKNEFDLRTYNDIYVYITHTHCDHVSGLGEFIQYAYYCLRKHVTVVAPSDYVSSDIKKLLEIEGVEDVMYTLTAAPELIESLITKSNSMLPKNVLGISIPTTHAEQLKNKCFGYQFNVNGTNVVYTGDSSTLEPFLPFLNAGTEFYMDTSVAFKNDVHIWLYDVLPTLLSLIKQGVKVYLMHLDNANMAKKIVKDIPGIEVVTKL